MGVENRVRDLTTLQFIHTSRKLVYFGKARECKTRSNIGPQKRLHIAVVAE